MKSLPAPSEPDESLLDAALIGQIAAAITPEPLDARSQQRIKNKLLRRIAADCTGLHLHPPPEAPGWQAFGDGITMKVLHESEGVMSYLLRMAPGAALPAHRHPVDEECVVLEGEVQIGPLSLGAGGFHLGRRHVLHDRLCSSGGALIFLRGAIPEAALAF